MCALRLRHADLWRQVTTLAATLPEAERGLLSALGWMSAEDLEGIVAALLGSGEPRHRAWGLAACAMQRLDPGAALTRATQDADPALRARAWRVAGRCGRRDLADAAHQELLARPSAHNGLGNVVSNLPEAQPDVWSTSRSAAKALTLWGWG